MSEYAAQREKEAGEFLAAAAALESALAGAQERAAGGEASTAAGGGLEEVGVALGALQAKLAESAAEAQAFHTQQRVDAERTKRSYSQARPQLYNEGWGPLLMSVWAYSAIAPAFWRTYPV